PNASLEHTVGGDSKPSLFPPHSGTWPYPLRPRALTDDAIQYYLEDLSAERALAMRKTPDQQ
ncbi:hypothetical protein PENTCL1PPCAC_4665, partial [Pristionchus entomophagus]